MHGYQAGDQLVFPIRKQGCSLTTYPYRGSCRTALMVRSLFKLRIGTRSLRPLTSLPHPLKVRTIYTGGSVNTSERPLLGVS